MKKVFYSRVSTLEQNTDRQVSQAPEAYLVLEDKISGRIPFGDRPSGSKIIKMAKAGEISEVRVHSITRLGRNQLDILATIKQLTALEVNVTSKKENLSMLNEDGSQNLFSNMLIGVLSSLSEFEIELSKEKEVDADAEVYEIAYKLYKDDFFEDAICFIDMTIPTLVEGSILVSKFELLKAYAIGKYQNKDSYIAALEKVAVGYPQTEQGKKALEIMKRLK